MSNLGYRSLTRQETSQLGLAPGSLQRAGIGRGHAHPFRASLPISALSVSVEPDVESKVTLQDDIRMFVLNFVAFFMGISLFIW